MPQGAQRTKPSQGALIFREPWAEPHGSQRDRAPQAGSAASAAREAGLSYQPGGLAPGAVRRITAEDAEGMEDIVPEAEASGSENEALRAPEAPAGGLARSARGREETRAYTHSSGCWVVGHRPATDLAGTCLPARSTSSLAQ